MPYRGRSFSGDMTKLDEFTLNVLCNTEVIEVDQDVLGKQGQIVDRTEDYFIMVKQMADGSKAVGLFNTAYIPTQIEVSLDKLGLQGGCRLRDLWRQKDIGVYQDKYSVTVSRGAVEMIRCFSAGK